MRDHKKEIPKWKKFEKFVADLQRRMSGGADVRANDKIVGISGVSRQIDVSLRKNVGQFPLLIVMDCKDWKSPVHIKGVEEFVGLVEDVKANKGAMVSNSGFTEAAKNKARQKGIDLLSAVDAESKDWPVYVSIPTVCDFRSLKSFQISFRYSGTSSFSMPNIDPRLIEVFSSSGERIDYIGNLIKKAWNDGRYKYEPGEYKGLPIYDEAMYMKIDRILHGPVDITLSIWVQKKLYFGQWPLSEVKGFKDEISGSLITNSIRTSFLDMREVEETWQEISSMDDLAVTPVLTLMANDYYSLLEKS